MADQSKEVNQTASKGNEPKSDNGKIIEDCMTSDLDRKKAEQARAREAIKEQREAGVDVDGSLGRGRLNNENLGDV